MDRKLKIWEMALLFGVLCAIMGGMWLDREQTQLANQVIRLHVIANSDSDGDQALKLKVRDGVLAQAEQLYPEGASLEQAAQALERNLAVLAAALTGGLAAFLIYNFHPAKVFMGDTGSLFLGGAVCGLAFASDMPLILVLVGIIYIAETLSDIIQVTYFKLTHGKRIFKMAPLHHHFEMCGWREKKVVAVFAAVSAVFCVIAYLGVRGRYL